MKSPGQALLPRSQSAQVLVSLPWAHCNIAKRRWWRRWKSLPPRTARITRPSFLPAAIYANQYPKLCLSAFDLVSRIIFNTLIRTLTFLQTVCDMLSHVISAKSLTCSKLVNFAIKFSVSGGEMPFSINILSQRARKLSMGWVIQSLLCVRGDGCCTSLKFNQKASTLWTPSQIWICFWRILSLRWDRARRNLLFAAPECDRTLKFSLGAQFLDPIQQTLLLAYLFGR